MGRGTVRGTRRPAVKARPKAGKKKVAKGRGMTVEGEDGYVLCVVMEPDRNVI